MFLCMISGRPFGFSEFPGPPQFAGCGNSPVFVVQTIVVAAVVLLGWAERVQEEGSG